MPIITSRLKNQIMKANYTIRIIAKMIGVKCVSKI